MTLVAVMAAVFTHPVQADQYTQRIAADQRQQHQLNQDMATIAAEIANAKNQEGTLRTIIAGLDLQVTAQQERVAAAKQALAATGVRLSQAQARLAAARVTLANEKRSLAYALVVIYELQNQSTPLSNLLTSGNFNAFWAGVINGRRISDQELRMVAQVRAQEDQIQRDITAISQVQQQQADEVSALYNAELQLDAQVAQRQVALNALGALVARDQHLAALWQAAYNQLNGAIAVLQREEAAAVARAEAAARARQHHALGGAMFLWPDSGPITQGFGCTPFTFEAYDPACPTKHFHNGIDIAGPCGNDITAAGPGIVNIEPYESWGFGNYIIIVHANGWSTLYGHMSAFAAHNGQFVQAGQLIGWEGSTGNSTGCHLHFGVNDNGTWVNPLAYLP